MSSEILREQDAENPDFAVVPVARDNVAMLASWPSGGSGIGGEGWPRAKGGPQSPVIRTGDMLKLVVWDNQENSLLASDSEKVVNMPLMTVSAQGTIFIPYLDEVVVSGQTPDQARRQIQTALTPIIPSAQVQLSVEPGKNNSADLVSGVASPGNYPLPDRNFTILSLLAQGGGIDKGLANPIVQLMRDGKNYEVRANDLLTNPAYNITLRGGDQVLVREDERYFTALGATGTQSVIAFDKDELTAVEALARIGGLEDRRADLKGVLILRDYPAKAVRQDGSGPPMQQVVFTIDLTSAEGLFAARSFRINPKDTVLVTEASLLQTRDIMGVLSAMIGLGNAANNN